MIAVCQGRRVAREALPTSVTRPERAGSRWMGVSHRDMAEAIVSSLGARGIGLLTEAWSLDGPTGARLIGGLDLRLPETYPKLEGQDYSLAVSTSNDLTRSTIIAVGTRVLVCHNGVVTGSFVMRRKHTTGFSLGTEMGAAVDRALEAFAGTAGAVRLLQERPMDELQVDHALMECGRQGVLPWSALGRALKLYGEPLHEEFRQWHGWAWGVYQACNEAIKVRNAATQVSGLRSLTAILSAA